MLLWGYTYRQPDTTADALSTAAVILTGTDGRADEHRSWLRGCLLPNEAGIMYMPARGAEIRCTSWALAAGVTLDDRDRNRVAAWLTTLQNPDGGFGYWEGRGSDVVSSTAAVDIARALGARPGDLIDIERLLSFLESCGSSDHLARYAVVPGAPTGLRATAKVLRIRAYLTAPDYEAAESLLDEHEVHGGGWADRGHRLPDLLTTFESVLLSDALGLPIDEAALLRFCDRVHTERGTAWSPLAPPDGGPLAECLGYHLTRRAMNPSHVVPALSLS
ncbi:MAG: terpene cyclase/mutase family protein [Pseudonocardia sp.]|nr:terpene cyclase/mutase family protein [Pseudonocardia sp.]